jgi:hypothetical protein
MTYLAGSLAVIVFAVVLDRSGLGKLAAGAIRISQSATETLRDRTLSEEQKEKAMREASSSLGKAFLSISIRGLAAVGCSLLVVAAFDISGMASFSSVTSWLAEPLTLILISTLVLVWFLVRRRT